MTTEQQIISYPVMEDFYTLQGEGYYAGQAAYFIRLGGCDVGCTWCDVKDSWDAARHPQINTGDIVKKAATQPGRIAVITGGEPAMYDLGPLSDALHKKGFRVHIETSGAYPVKGNIDWVTLSPKKFKAPLMECLEMADELKVVVYNKTDFEWAEHHAKKVESKCKLYLQPEWGKREQMNPLIVNYIQEHPQWQLSLQTHKYINIP